MCDIRRGPLLQCAVTRGREQPQRGTKQEDQQQSPKELGHRQPDDREARCETIDHPAAPHRGDNPERDAERRDDRHSCRTDHRGAAKRGPQHRRDRYFHDQRASQIAAQRAGGPFPILREERSRQPQFRFQRGDGFGRRILPEHDLGDAGRHGMRCQEHQYRHQDDDADNRSETLHDVKRHRVFLQSGQSPSVTVFRFSTLSREAAKPRTRLLMPVAWLTTNKTGPGPSLAAIS